MAVLIGEEIMLELANKELARLDKLLAKKDAEITAVMEAPMKQFCLIHELESLRKSPCRNISKDLSVLEKQISDLDKLVKKDWRKLKSVQDKLRQRRTYLAVEIEMLNWRIDSLSNSEGENDG